MCTTPYTNNPLSLTCKFRVRKRCRRRKKHKLDELTESLENYIGILVFVLV